MSNQLDKAFNITPEVLEEEKSAVGIQKPDRLTKDDITTVSYTHLRAHETPEHRRCRSVL